MWYTKKVYTYKDKVQIHVGIVLQACYDMLLPIVQDKLTLIAAIGISLAIVMVCE